MRLREKRVLLAGLIDNELSTITKEKLLKHIEKCQDCQREMQHLRKADAEISLLPRVAYKEQFLEAQRASILSSVAKVKVKPFRWAINGQGYEILGTRPLRFIVPVAALLTLIITALFGSHVFALLLPFGGI